jgi:tetratricopeptide (TPR) repeat protein
MDQIREAMTDAGEHEALSQTLTQMAEKWPERIEPLEWLVELYGRTSDSFRLPDALANLAKAYEAAGNHEKALQAFEQLLDRDPENESVRRECERLRAPSVPGRAVPPTPPASPVQLAEAQPKPAAPLAPGEPADEETQQFLAQALTDVDLFSSYGLTQKAMDLLETVLQRVPGNTVALERLLDLYLGAGDDRRTAELAAQLEQLHKKHGDQAAADRFSELRRRYGRAAGEAPPEAAAPAAGAPPPEFAIPVVDAEPVPEPAPEFAVAATEESKEDAATSSVHEVDLSDEWAALAGQVDTAALPSEHTALAEANRAAELAKAALTGASKQAEKTQEPEPDYVLELDAAPSETVAAGGADADSASAILNALSADFNAAVPALVGPPPEQGTPAHQTENNTPHPNQNGSTQPPTAAQQLVGPLGEVFDQFRADMGEASVEGEDLETHYNLGIAYREMGLLEEAISEFQKVAKANNTKQAFRYAMQCCTLLGLAFMERGQPAIAAMWYERALDTPGLDQETILALRYDLGVAQELAGDTSAARKSFSQVYGVNIDYRDVGERLAALGKG